MENLRPLIPKSIDRTLHAWTINRTNTTKLKKKKRTSPKNKIETIKKKKCCIENLGQSDNCKQLYIHQKWKKKGERKGEREKKKNRGREQVDFPQWQRRYRAFEKAINISANQRIHKARTPQKRSIHTGGL